MTASQRTTRTCVASTDVEFRYDFLLLKSLDFCNSRRQWARHQPLLTRAGTCVLALQSRCSTGSTVPFFPSHGHLHKAACGRETLQADRCIIPNCRHVERELGKSHIHSLVTFKEKAASVAGWQHTGPRKGSAFQRIR